MPVDDEGIVLDILQEGLADIEENGNMEDDKEEHKARRKSFGDGLCTRTLKARFAELDDRLIGGINSLLFSARVH